MKILHVININGYGGAEKLLLQLLPAQNKIETVECVILYPEGNKGAALDIGSRLANEKKVTIHFIEYKKWFERKIFQSLRQIINKKSFEIVHSHLKHADIWMAVLKKTRRINVPVVSTMHGYNDAYENEHGFNIHPGLRFSFYFQISKLIYKQMDGFILISRIVSDFFRKTKLITRKKQAVIYHGYEQVSAPHNGKLAKRENYDVAIPGRIIKRKGHSYLIDAVKILKQENVNVTVHIYGLGEEEYSLRNYAEKSGVQAQVIFHGYVDKIIEEISKSDIVVIPSLWEGFGLVFLDAFAAGVPVVAFDLPAANEIITHEKNGLLAVPYSSESLAQNIKQLIENPQLGDFFVKNGLADLQSRFSVQTMANKYIDFYRSVLSN